MSSQGGKPVGRGRQGRGRRKGGGGAASGGGASSSGAARPAAASSAASSARRSAPAAPAAAPAKAKPKGGGRVCVVANCSEPAATAAGYCVAHDSSQRERRESFTVNTRITVGVDDMTLLTKDRLTNKGIAENLRARLSAGDIYTYIGAVLVVVNPYRWLDIYDGKHLKLYPRANRIDVPPHVFATAEEAYRTMLQEEENQCVIISGESGAGKTEASKQIQSYIAAVSGKGAGVDRVKTIFLESNPLLEAFGNAKTLRNNNSSRFGKYFTLQFDGLGRPRGGNVTNYLLEKSRIRPSRGERSFHIFYQLLAGAPAVARRGLHIGAPEDFRYLSGSGTYTVSGNNGKVSDAKEFADTMNAMRAVGLSSKEMEVVFKLVSAVLHLGNVSFEPQRAGDTEGSGVAKASATSMGAVAELLGVPADKLARVLTYRVLETMGVGGKMERYNVPNNLVQAANARDSLAKSLYFRLFDWLVARVNKALEIGAAEGGDGADDDGEMLSIGILDIYGFEVFENNSFEQFCINYVNEKLQQIFIERTLRGEQDEYGFENIKWTPIKFFDNKVVCDLIEGRRPPGVFSLLDDTCRTMHAESSGLDSAFVEKVSGIQGSHAHYSSSGSSAFTIKHYAGDVRYTASGFCEMNKDTLSIDVIALMKTATNKLVAFVFPEDVDNAERRQQSTSGLKIKTQCGSLVKALMDCTPHYVRCIKPNDRKAPGGFELPRVVHQTQYLGLLENIRVRRAGFAFRQDYDRFLTRYKYLSGATFPNEWRGTDKDGCKAILKEVAPRLRLTKEEVQMGRTKLFIRQAETFFALEALRSETFSDFVGAIQRAWRQYSARRYFVQLRAAATRTFTKGKARRRESIFRPFHGLYLRDKAIEKAVQACIDANTERDDDTGGGGAAGAGAAAAAPKKGKPSAPTRLGRTASFLEDDFVETERPVFLDVVDRVTDAATATESAGATWMAGGADGAGAGAGAGAAAGAGAPRRRGARPSAPQTVSSLRARGGDEAVAASGAVGLQALVMAITKKAVYFMDFAPHRPPVAGFEPPSEPVFRLNVRVPLADVENLVLSRNADNFVLMQVRPQAPMAAPQTSHWQPDAEAVECGVCHRSFGFLTRRHHCRKCGKVVCKLCSPHLGVALERGHYDDVRLCSRCVPLGPASLPEDVLLHSCRKTELATVLADLVRQHARRTLNIKFEAGVSLRRAAQASRLPCAAVEFGGGGARGTGMALARDRLKVSAPPGLPADVVAERQAREKQRRVAAERRRAAEEEIRKKREAERAVQREKERKRRLREKKARRAEERAKREAADQDAAASEARRAAVRARSRRGPGAAAGAGAAAAAAPPSPPCRECGCTDFLKHAFKAGYCNNCFHNH